jgi:hypothetical protein
MPVAGLLGEESRAGRHVGGDESRSGRCGEVRPVDPKQVLPAHAGTGGSSATVDAGTPGGRRRTRLPSDPGRYAFSSAPRADGTTLAAEIASLLTAASP